MRISRLVIGVTAVGLVVGAPGTASASVNSPVGSTQLISRTSAGASADGASVAPSISRDRSIVVFASSADDLVEGDSNGLSDVFALDRTTGSLTLVTQAADGAATDGDSTKPSVSANGRFVTYVSRATNLVAEPTNGSAQVYVTDLHAAHTTTLVSVDTSGLAGDADSLSATISRNGRFVAFDSKATNLVAGDTNRRLDVFLHDVSAATTTLVSAGLDSKPGNNDSFDPSMDRTGAHVAFSSYASNLVSDDRGGELDVFVLDTIDATLSLVSRTPNGKPANAPSYAPSISADGVHVAFSSNASDLVSSDTNATTDVFVRDLPEETTALVSTAPSGQSANGPSFAESISSDGSVVTFNSYATDLVAGDDNLAVDVFARAGGADVQLVSNGTGAESADGASDASDISGNGRAIVFESLADNLVGDDDNGLLDVFLYRRP